MEVGPLILLTLLLLSVTYIFAEFGQYQEIRANWPIYKCQPQITPFAAFYGFNLEETLNFCIQEQVKAHAGGVITPIYKGIDEVMTIVDGVYDKAEKISGGVEGLLSGFKSFVMDFANSFRLLGVRVRMSLIRTKDIFARVYGMFIAFAYAAISAITFGENLICNPLVTFVAGFAGVDICCFAPETRVAMADGTHKAIRDIAIGDALNATTRVTSRLVFDGTGVPMVRVRGVHVSGNHQLRSDDRWIPASEHPDAVKAESIPRIYCLNTTSNRIPVIGSSGTILEFTDYEESSDPAVIAEAQQAAEIALNSDGSYGAGIPDYSLGLDPTFTVLTGTGAWTPLDSVKIGDVLAGGRRVSGVIREMCDSIVETEAGFLMAAAQLIQTGPSGKWRRAGKSDAFTRLAGRSTILCHLMLDTDGSFAVGGDGEVFNVRHYAETTETQDAYDAYLAVKS